MRRRSRWIWLILALLTVGFIFSNSLPSIPDSRAQSSRVLELLEPLFAVFVGENVVTLHFVRKLAHFVEFGALGVELGFLYARRSAAPFLTALLVALSDETIQIFAQRGSQVKDVWLDFSGASTGIVVSLLFLHLLRRKNRK